MPERRESSGLPGAYWGYLAFHVLACPVLGVRSLLKSKRRETTGLVVERLFATSSPPHPAPWGVVVATNLGEAQVGAQVVRELREAGLPDVGLVVGYNGGLRAARGAGVSPLGVAPFNNPLSALRFLSRWTPRFLLFVEWPDWPHLLAMARSRGVPTAVVNAYFAQRDLERAKRWRVRMVDLYGAQSHPAAQRLRLAGAQRVEVHGPSATRSPVDPERARELAAKWRAITGAAGRLVVAGSTYAEEERAVLSALGPRDRLILAPRLLKDAGAALERAKEVGDAALRSEGRAARVVVLDTQGELADTYCAADAAYVGGTWSPGVGGHTPQEALAAGLPVVLGPHFEQQESWIEALRAAGLATVVHSTDELSQALARTGPNPGAQPFLAAHEGAFRRFALEHLAGLSPR